MKAKIIYRVKENIAIETLLCLCKLISFKDKHVNFVSKENNIIIVN